MFFSMYCASLSASDGLDLELLDDARPDQAEQDRGEHQQREPHRRQQPGAPPDVEEEQHRADQRDAHQDALGRQHRVVVGVGDAGEQRARTGGPGRSGPASSRPPWRARRRRAAPRAAPARRRRAGRRASAAGSRRTGSARRPAASSATTRDRHRRSRRGSASHGRSKTKKPMSLLEVGVLALERHAVAPEQVVAPLPRAGGAGEDAEQHARRRPPARCGSA